MEERICAILPYRELFDIARKCKNEFFPNIQIREGHVEDAIPVAREAERKGAEVIISRGGTAAIIRRNVNIPVVEIKVSDLDLLRILYPFRDSNSNLLAAGYKNAVSRCRAVGEVLGINIIEIIVPYENEKYNINDVKSQAELIIRKSSIDALVGDQTALINLESLCNRRCLITSGKEDVIEAIVEAENIIAAKNQEKEKSKRFQAVLDFINDGVISTDENGIITVYNPTAEKIFEVKKEMAIGRSIDDVIKDDRCLKILNTNSPELEHIQRSPKGSILINSIPITVEDDVKGIVATFNEVSKIQGAEQKIRENMYSKGFVTRYSFHDILTKDSRVKKLIQMAKDYSKTDGTILIEGESGTGKEMFAQSIHASSSRSNGPFVAVNCAALPPQLLESELFGYVEGAFTGAAKGGKIGLFEMAHKGTIFLDEIGELDKSLQARFLRVLEERQIMRIGSDKIIHIDVRVIAATNCNLKNQINKGSFRPDLYYRLNVLNLYMVPLRERNGDVEYLANYFLRINNKKYGLQVENLAPEVIRFLEEHSWPGNIRELRNVIERIVLTARRDNILLKDIELIANEIRKNVEIYDEHEEFEGLMVGTLNEIKSKIVAKVLREEGYNKSRAAKRLGIDRSTLDRIL